MGCGVIRAEWGGGTDEEACQARPASPSPFIKQPNQRNRAHLARLSTVWPVLKDPGRTLGCLCGPSEGLGSCCCFRESQGHRDPGHRLWPLRLTAAHAWHQAAAFL